MKKIVDSTKEKKIHLTKKPTTTLKSEECPLIRDYMTPPTQELQTAHSLPASKTPSTLFGCLHKCVANTRIPKRVGGAQFTPTMDKKKVTWRIPTIAGFDAAMHDACKCLFTLHCAAEPSHGERVRERKGLFG